MPFLDHPAFQSLVLPLLLAAALTVLLHQAAGPRWALLGAAFGLVLAQAFWPGFAWPAVSHAQKLPWVVASGLVVALAATAWRMPGSRALGRAPGLGACALLALAGGGLALWTGLGGSLLLAQLALMTGAASAVALVWSGWRAAPVSPVALLPMGLALLWIALALLGQPIAPDGAADDPYYTPRWD